MSIAAIKIAVGAEIKATPKFIVVTVIGAKKIGQALLLDVRVKPIHGATATPLTEDIRNAHACSYFPNFSTGIVSRVDTNNSQIRLNKVKGTLPQVGQEILLYPQDFMKPVLAPWQDDTWAEQAFDCLHDLSHPEPIKSNPLSAKKYPFLRPAQRRALTLVGYSSSFLFGPPGTGKTTTLGVVIAEFLVANPHARVLLVSTTNLAVDQVLLAVDKVLERGNETSVRRQLRRIGQGYDRRLYASREHLLPKSPVSVTVEETSVGDDYDMATDSPEPTCIGETGANVRLQARTTASVIAGLSSLRTEDQFDLVVLDEASQISVTHTLLVMPLGKARLFAGDPEQLAPIAKSKTQSVQRWLARSAFAFMPTTGHSTCFLNEQSRMAGPICTIVSEIFYNCGLRVADDAVSHSGWLRNRSRNMGHIPIDEHVSIQYIYSDASRTRERNGWMRRESAQRTIDLIQSAISEGHSAQSEIVVITPYRLQRAYLREQLDLLELTGIKVSTVHSCQGSEAPFVIFDPVFGTDEFLMNKIGRQLINVAISRAQAKLIVMLSAQDLQNPIFSQMVAIVERFSKSAAQVPDTPELPAV